MKAQDIAIKDISIGDRARRDLGDIDALVLSIEQCGLLHPIVVTDDMRLVAGRRRIEAFKRMGHKNIPAVFTDCLDSALSMLTAERDENTCREPFKPSEAVAMGRMLEELEKPKAHERMAVRGEKFSQVKAAEKGKTREKVAAAVGMSHPTYKRAKRLVEAAEREPEKYMPALKEMDTTGKVTTAHNRAFGVPTYKPSTNPRKTAKKYRPRLENIVGEIREMVNQPFSQVPVIQLRALVNELYELIFSTKESV